jgi:hypothetical protein
LKCSIDPGEFREVWAKVASVAMGPNEGNDKAKGIVKRDIRKYLRFQVPEDDGPAMLIGTDGTEVLALPVPGVADRTPGVMLLPQPETGRMLGSSKARIYLACPSMAHKEFSIAFAPGKVKGAITVKTDFAPADWPDMYLDRPADWWRFKAASLRTALNGVTFASDVSGGRYQLDGVFFDPDGPGTVDLVAADGRRLSAYRLEADREGPSASSARPIISAGSVKSIVRLVNSLDPEAIVEVGFSPNRVAVESGMAIYNGPLAEGVFPDWRRIRNAASGRSTLSWTSVEEIRRAVGLASVATALERRGIVFSVDSGRFRLEAQAPDRGRARVDAEPPTGKPPSARREFVIDGEHTLEILDVLRSLNLPYPVEVRVPDDPAHPVMFRCGPWSCVLMTMVQPPIKEQAPAA